MFHRMSNYGEMEARPTVVLTRDLIKKLMPKFKRHEDLLVVQEQAWEEFKKSLPIPVVKEENSPFSIDEDELASLVCQTIQKPPCSRLAVEKGIKNDDYRTPDVELILGDHGIVNHKENHIIYRFDVTKCMFSFGNINEKMRMGELNCADEIVVDLFAGIGYFSLPLLVHAKARHLYACEWNPAAVDALKKNLALNKIEPTRYTVIEGDNRSNRPTDVAQRVILGILPSCIDWMQTAFECIDKNTGAMLHCHDLVESKPVVVAGDNKNNSNNSLNSANNNNNGTNTSFGTSTSLDNNSAASSSSLLVSSGETRPQQSPSSATNQSLLNQSISSSSSSHSTIEKLSVPSDDKTSESDKDTNSPVLLEKPTNTSSTNISISPPESSANDTSSISSNHEDSNFEPIQINDIEFCAFEAKAQTLIDRIKDEVDAHDLRASLVQIQPVKSYAPHITHVVFDIKIEPKIKNLFRIPPLHHVQVSTSSTNDNTTTNCDSSSQQPPASTGSE